MGIRVWKIELRELENHGTFALRRAKKSALEMEMASFIALPFAKNMSLLPLGESKSVLEMEMASFIALLFAKNMPLLPLGEPKIGTENELAPRSRKI